MHTVLKQISQVGLVPVIKLEEPNNAVSLCSALAKGGIPVAEVTFRAKGAEKAIFNIANALPQVLVGAGTVTTVEQAKAAASAGAKYIISPGFDPVVVEYCLSHNILITPGCATAGDLCMASRMGLEVVKFFPAEAAGGIRALKAFFGPFAQLKFMPTGGINAQNVTEYLAHRQIIACGGSWMAPEKLIAEQNWSGITAVAEQAVLGMLQPRLTGLTLPGGSDESANPLLANLGLESGSFAVAQAEAGATEYSGWSLTVNSVERAVTYFTAKGLTFLPQTAKHAANGACTEIQLANKLAGFSVTLRQA